jgi:hypothetical protein
MPAPPDNVAMEDTPPKRRFQFKLRTLLLAIVAVSLALAAMRFASAAWVSGAVSATVGVFISAIAIGIGSSGVRGAFWIAFAACGGAYLIVTMSFNQEFVEQLVTSKVVALARDAFHPPSDYSHGGLPDETPPALMSRQAGGTLGVEAAPWLNIGPDYAVMNTNFVLIGQCIWSLILAMLGGMLARFAAVSRAPDRS